MAHGDKYCTFCSEFINESNDENCNVKYVEKNLNLKSQDKDIAQENVLDVQLENQEEPSEKFNTHAEYVAENLRSMLETKGLCVEKNVLLRFIKKTALNAKYAGNLCEKCGTNIAAALAEAKLIHYDPKKQMKSAYLTCMKNVPSSILHQNIVSFVEMMGSIDIIPTIMNLSLLFGSVHHATEKYIKKESLNQSGNNDHPQFRYVAKPSRAEKEAGLEGFEFPVMLRLKDDLTPEQVAFVTTELERRGLSL